MLPLPHEPGSFTGGESTPHAIEPGIQERMRQTVESHLATRADALRALRRGVVLTDEE